MGQPQSKSTNSSTEVFSEAVALIVSDRATELIALMQTKGIDINETFSEVRSYTLSKFELPIISSPANLIRMRGLCCTMHV